MKELITYFDNLSPEKQELVLKKLLVRPMTQVIGTGEQISSAILPVSRDGVLPLSFAQQRLWFLDQFEPNSPWYNVPSAVRLTGSLDADAVAKSLTEIVRRHEALRTIFVAIDGQPRQIIAPAMTMPLPVVDLSELPEAAREAEALRLTREEARRLFDLAQGPLMRGTLLRLGEADHVLLLTMHHIISDGWSMGVLIRELVTLSEAFSCGRPSPLPELSIQYADFAVWQRQWLQGAVLERQLSYWKERLSGSLLFLELPMARPRPPVQTYHGTTERFVLPTELSRELKELSLREGVTLFMTLLAAFQTLLYRYSGQQDIIVGIPIANRNRAEIEDLIGFFVNTLALRTDMSGNPPFSKLLACVKETTLGAYAHQDLPFEMLVEALQPERDTSHPPIVQVMFVLQNAPMEIGSLKDLTVTLLNDQGTVAKFDLMLNMEEKNEGITCFFEYNTDLFDATTIARMTGHLQALLQGIVADPGKRLSDLSILTETERSRLLMECNNTKTAYPGDKCIHEFFEAQVKKNPDAVALVFEDQHLTYRELNALANQLAHHLQQLGIGPEVLTGICVERSLEMVIGLLGILKAGGAYVPLDPAYPKERLSFMLEDARVPVLLTQQKLVADLPEYGGRLVRLDADWDLIKSRSTKNPATKVTAGNTAYVIYTSGSTGRPKGVMVRHDNVVRLFTATDSCFHFSSQDVWSLFHSYAFDFSVWELWGALLYGGRLVVVPYLVSRSPETFYELLYKEQVTVLNQTPSAFRQLIHAEEGGVSKDLSLRLVIFGGEALELQSLKPWFTRHGDQLPLLVNMYGITETTVHVTYRLLTSDDLNGKGSVIGSPIPDLQLFILDRHQQPVPIGVPGEMYVGGAGLSAGYLNRPELTAERFVPNPFHSVPGARLYRSGDLARYLPQGDIEYLGRIDHQVKIRGFRIELGEIEATLAKHQGIRENLVLPYEVAPNDNRLVGYVVPLQGFDITVSDLRSFLNEKLPDYMVPASFIFMERLPLTANGKVDRKALPAPDTSRPELEGVYIAPRTSVEESLAGIWSQVLGIDRVGVNDNFFELGGDSILSIQVIARANEAGIKLTPKQIFQHQAIAELAAVAGTESPIAAEQGVVTGPVPLTPIQHWFFEQDIANRHHWNQAVLLEARESLNPEWLKQSVHHLLMHHDAFRLRFESPDAVWRQVVSEPQEETPFIFFDLAHLTEPKQSAILEKSVAELQASLNIGEGPLLRVAMFALGAHRTSRVFVVIHHLAVDGVSWRILLEDLHTAYNQLSLGKEIKLPQKTTSFKQWSERLAEYVHSGKQHLEKDYWLAAAQKHVSPLAVDYAGENTIESTRTVSAFLNEEETRTLLKDVPLAYHTQINDVLLAALADAFSRWTREYSLLIDLEGHGREDLFHDVDLSRTVGWFTSLFPVCLDLNGAEGPGEALKLIKEQLRGIPNHGIGYGVLSYLGNDEAVNKQLDTISRPQVSFNYLGQFDQLLSNSPLFGLAPEPAGPTHSRIGTRIHLLEIDCLITAGRLQMTWTYSQNIHSRKTIENLAQGFLESLRTIMSHCLSSGAGGYTPSDFQSNLSQKDINDIVEELELSLEGNRNDDENR